MQVVNKTARGFNIAKCNYCIWEAKPEAYLPLYTQMTWNCHFWHLRTVWNPAPHPMWTHQHSHGCWACSVSCTLARQVCGSICLNTRWMSTSHIILPRKIPWLKCMRYRRKEVIPCFCPEAEWLGHLPKKKESWFLGLPHPKQGLVWTCISLPSPQEALATRLQVDISQTPFQCSFWSCWSHLSQKLWEKDVKPGGTA